MVVKKIIRNSGESLGCGFFCMRLQIKTIFQNNKNNTKAVAFQSNINSHHKINEYANTISKNNQYCLFCSIDAMLGIDYGVLS